MRKLSGTKCAIMCNVDKLDRCLTCPQLIHFFPVICASFLNDNYMCTATLGSTGEVQLPWSGKVRFRPVRLTATSLNNYNKSYLAYEASKKVDGKGYKPVSRFRRREKGSPEAKKAYYKTAHAYDKKLSSLYSELIRKKKSSRWFIDHRSESGL